MAEIFDFDEARRARDNDNPARRHLAKLAEKLATTMLKDSDREKLARNWHDLLAELKTKPGIKKAEIYKVLQREGTFDDAAKRSQQYEVPEGMEGEKLKIRVKQLTKKGKKWLKVIESAGKKATPAEALSFLTRVLLGTSLLPDRREPSLDTPDPVRAVLKLANAACEGIAERTNIKQFFENWARGWISYRHRDSTFHLGSYRHNNRPFYRGYYGLARFPGQAEVEDTTLVQSHFFLIDEDGPRFKDDDTQPLPSAQFGEETIAGAIAAEAHYRTYAEDTAEWHAETAEADAAHEKGAKYDVKGSRVELSLSFVRQYRLAIGLSVDDKSIAPVLEVRDIVRLKDAEGREHAFIFDEYFRGCRIVDTIGDAIQAAEDSVSDAIKAAEDNSGQDMGIFWGEGHLQFPGRANLHWCSLESGIYKTKVEELQEKLVKAGERISGEFVRGSGYYLLTPKNAELLSRCEVDAEMFVPTLNKGCSALRALEIGLLAEAQDGSLYDRLLKNAEKIVRDFDQVYQQGLQHVVASHSQALAELGGRLRRREAGVRP